MRLSNFYCGLLLLGFLGGLSGISCRTTVKAVDQVCFKEQCIFVEIADDDPERRRGLQHREGLPDKSGMLFVFEEMGTHSFWMKDTKISLDLIWLDPSRRIVHMEQQVEPCRNDPCSSYTPLQKARYVLEVNAGKAQNMGLRVGEQLEFRLDRYLSR
jgi:uncharacterized protein